MTDNEIIKALECCASSKDTCEECPAFVNVDCSNCKQVLKGAIDLINHQKAELDFYKNSPLIRIFDSWKKDVEAEAYKEFAERLLCFEHPVYCYHTEKGHSEIKEAVYVETVKNLLKEMMGEDNAYRK